MWKKTWMNLGVFGILLGALVGSASGWTNTGGGDHGGEDWIITQSSVEIAGVHTNIGTFRIQSGKTVLVKAYECVRKCGRI